MRQKLIAAIADRIIEMRHDGVLKIAIDGVDGAGKTCFADELAEEMNGREARVIRSSVDFFHNPRLKRYERGQFSPEGYFTDSFNYSKLKEVLLDPLSPGGSLVYQPAFFDHKKDQEVEVHKRTAASGSILIFDGIFLHRNELVKYWDFSIFLTVNFTVSVPRFAKRDKGPTDFRDPLNQRYVGGQELYFAACSPSKRASLVIENNDLACPRVIGGESLEF
ncbi:MAG: uridine kinase [Oligoflexales bacterium]